MKKRIAIIGAGISGLTLAQNLKEYADVVVFEKARNVGGRMSTRYADPFCFDHGAQYFTARSPEFQDFLQPFMEAGIIAEWQGKLIHVEVGKPSTDELWREPHLVATPNMNSLCKKLAQGIDVRCTTEIAPLLYQQSGLWALQDMQGQELGEYDWIISTAPPAQTLKLLQAVLPDSTSLHKARMQGCFALMLGFNQTWSQEWIAAKVHDNPIQWISINSSKPGRSRAVTAIVVHSCHDWAMQHIDDDVRQVEKCLLEQFEASVGFATANAAYIELHRWKYAIAEVAHQPGFYVDSKHNLAATSDWASTSRIENVWLNAKDLANRIIQSI